MGTGKSFLSPAGVLQIGQVKRDALATKLALQDPPVLISVRRFVGGTTVDKGPFHVALTVDTNAQTQSDQMSEAVGGRRMVGKLKAFAADVDIRTGDVFIVPQTNWQGTILDVAPINNGILSADLRIEMGSAI